MGDEWDNEEFNIDDVEEEAADAHPEAVRNDNVIICIDARANMMEHLAGNEPQLAAAFRVGVEILRNKIATSEQAKVGVLLLGTEKSENIRRAPNVHCLLPLDTPSVGSIRILQALAEDINGFPQAFGQVSNLPVHHALSVCMDMFRAGAKQTDYRRIFILTNDDAPQCDVNAAETRAADAEEDNIDITIFPIQRPPPASSSSSSSSGGSSSSRNFDVNGFWQSIAIRPGADTDDDDVPAIGGEGGAGTSAGGGSGEEGGSASGAATSSSSSSSSSQQKQQHRSRRGGAVEAVSEDGSFEDILRQIRRRLIKKRTYARVSMTLAPGVHIGVSLYNNYYPAKKPTAKQLFAETKQPIKTESRYLDASTGDPLSEHEFMLHHKVGDTNVFFTPDEAKQLRMIGGKDARGIDIVGFQPRERLREADNLRPPYFVYPSERDIEGSTTMFRALWQRMLDRDLIAIAMMSARDASAPRVVALVPEQERCVATSRTTTSSSSSGSSSSTATRPFVSSYHQASPPGMYAVVLPFADDVRNVQAIAAPHALEGSKAAENAARQLVRKISSSVGIAVGAGSGGGGSAAAAAAAAEDENENENLTTTTTTSSSSSSSSAATRKLVTSALPTNVMIPNPALHRFYRGLEALALNLHDIDKRAEIEIQHALPGAVEEALRRGGSNFPEMGEGGGGGSATKDGRKKRVLEEDEAAVEQEIDGQQIVARFLRETGLGETGAVGGGGEGGGSGAGGRGRGRGRGRGAGAVAVAAVRGARGGGAVRGRGRGAAAAAAAAAVGATAYEEEQVDGGDTIVQYEGEFELDGEGGGEQEAPKRAPAKRGRK